MNGNESIRWLGRSAGIAFLAGWAVWASAGLPVQQNAAPDVEEDSAAEPEAPGGFPFGGEIFEELLRGLGVDPQELADPGNWDKLFRGLGQPGGPQGNRSWEDLMRWLQDLGAVGAPEPGDLTPEEVEQSDQQFRDLLEAHRPAVREASLSTVVMLEGDQPRCLGVVVRADGWVLTKASEVEQAGEALRCFVGGEVVPARMAQVFSEHDLALVRVEKTDLTAVRFSIDPLPPLGSFLAAAGPGEDALAIGVLSVAPRSLSVSRGYLGVLMETAENGVRIQRVEKGTPAEAAGVREGDVVTSVEGVPCASMMEMAMAVGSRRPGEEVAVRLLRNGEEMELRVQLGERPGEGPGGGEQRFEMMNQMGGALSKNRGGYPQAIQHDLPLRPEECGGPLVDLEGRVIGVNIARAGRIASYAIPAAEVDRLLAGFDFGAAPAPAPEVSGLEALREAVQAANAAVEAARKALDDAEAKARAAEEALRRQEEQP